MKYKKIGNQSFNLHLIKTDKFKTIFFKFVFREEIKKEDITIRNLLFDVLTTTSFKYNSKRLMSIKMQELYGLSCYANTRRVGYHITSELSFSILDPKYSNDTIIKDSVLFMKELIFNPNIKDNCFDEEYVNISKSLIKTDIISQKEYSFYYSSLRAKEAMNKDAPFSYNIDGYLEDLDKITSKELYNYYKRVVNTNLIDLYVIGDIDFYEIEELIKNNICFRAEEIKETPIIKDYICSTKTKQLLEQGHFNQSRLVMGIGFKKLSKKEKLYVLPLYNSILGNSPKSKLFENIRESKSLAYDINSIYYKNDNILLITTGINLNVAGIAITSIKEELDGLRKGIFTQEDLIDSKELIISSLKSFEEFPNTIAEYYFSMQYLGTEKYEKMIKEINKITKEEIIKVSKKIIIDTIYILKEKDNEKIRNQ